MRQSFMGDAGADDSAVRLRLWCLGGFRIEIDGAEVDCGVARPKTRSLLRLLALHAGSRVHREVLLDSLWPDLSPAAGLRNLHVTLCRLRRLLEPGAGRGNSTLLTRDGEAYGLAVANSFPGALGHVGFVNDVREFDRLAVASLRSRETVEMYVDTLREAHGWYGGDLLPEEGPAEWVAGERDRLRAQAARVCAALAEAELRLGRPDSSVAAAELGLRLDAFQDHAWRVLVAARQQTGDPAAAEQTRRRYDRMLRSLSLAPAR